MKENVVLYKSVVLVSYITYFIEALLIVRLVLKFLGAGTGSSVVSGLYGVSAVFLAPFSQAFNNTSFWFGVIEWNTLFAMLVYALVAEGIIRLIGFSRPVSEREANRGLRQSEEL